MKFYKSATHNNSRENSKSGDSLASEPQSYDQSSIATRMSCTNIYTNNGSIISSVKASNEEFHKRLRRLYPCVDDVSTLPQTWSNESKAPTLGLTHNKLGCYFRGNGRREEDEKFAAAVRTDNYIPPACLLYYYEIRFISKGREGFMGLGLTSSNALLTKLPGWVRESYGYHADDGNIFNGDGRGSPFGPTFTTGDVIGCGYNLVEGKCFFTKNGLNLGKAFEDIPSNILFYPTVGLKTPGEDVEANFGQNEFVYDIEQDLRSLRKNMTLSISNFPIRDFGEFQTTLHKLVQSWLLQNSYPDTAVAFSKSAKLECSDDLESVRSRKHIQQLVLSGRISEAIEATDRLCADVLRCRPNLLLALRCRQFIELIGGSENDLHPVFECKYSSEAPTEDQEMDSDEQKFAKLIRFGQELCDYHDHLEKFHGKNEDNTRMLKEAISLIAVINPKDSPRGSLLDPSRRIQLSQQLDFEIVRQQPDTGHSYKPPMERFMNELNKLVRMNDCQGRWLLDNLQ